jgi:hypothetical protein
VIGTVTTSSDYKTLLVAIENHETGNVRKLLEKTDLFEKSLLDVAASGSRSEVMALLIEHDIKQWVGSKENNLVFIRLIEDYMTLRSARLYKKNSPKTDKEPKTIKQKRKQKRRMDVLDDSADTTKAIQHLLKSQPKWLISQLRGKALVRKTSKIVGNNISWLTSDGLPSAYDLITGRQFLEDQVLFEKPVQLLLRVQLDDEDEEDEYWPVEIKGTTKEVLEEIYSQYEPIFQAMGDRLVFQGLKKMGEGMYTAYLGSSKSSKH